MQDKPELGGPESGAPVRPLQRFDSGIGMESDADSRHEPDPHAVTAHVLEDYLHAPGEDEVHPPVARTDSGLGREEADTRSLSSTASVLHYYSHDAGSEAKADGELTLSAPAPDSRGGNAPEPRSPASVKEARHSPQDQLRDVDRVIDFRADRARPVKILGNRNGRTGADAADSSAATRQGLPRLAAQPPAHPYESVARQVLLPAAAKPSVVDHAPDRDGGFILPRPARPSAREPSQEPQRAAENAGYAGAVAEARQQFRAKGMPRWAAGALAHAKTRLQFGATRSKVDAALSRNDEADRMARAIEARVKLGNTQRMAPTRPDAPPRFVPVASLNSRRVEEGIDEHNARTASDLVKTAFGHDTATQPIRDMIAKNAKSRARTEKAPPDRQLDPRSRERASLVR